MFHPSRPHVLRLFLGSTLLVGLLACSDSGCSCVRKLDQPMSDATKIYDALQTRLTPKAIDFIEKNLAGILQDFVPGGLTFDVPLIDATQRFCLFEPLCIEIKFLICQENCQLTASIVENSAKITRQSPDTLIVDLQLNLAGSLTVDGSVDCGNVELSIQNKPVQAKARLFIDDRDHLLSFSITDIQVSLHKDDIDFDCDWGFLDDICLFGACLGDLVDEILNWIVDLLIPTLNDLLLSQVGDLLGEALAGFMCLPCDFYNYGCPSGTDCVDGRCVDDSCRLRPLGIVGEIELGELLAGIGLGIQASVDVFAAAGQWQTATADPLVVANGIQVRLIGGMDAAKPSACSPVVDPAQIPTTAPPPRLVMNDSVPTSGQDYMLGIGISDVFLDWALYKATQSGALCLSIDSAMTNGLLSSKTLGALLGSLNELTNQENTPVRLDLLPNRFPTIEIGSHTTESALLNILLEQVSLDFYVLLHQRWTRVVTLTQDIRLEVGLDFTPDNKIMLLFDDDSILIDNVQAKNYDLLAEDPAALEQLLPTLIGLALPLLTEALAPIEIPTIEGFVPRILSVHGEMPKGNSAYNEYLTIYTDLERLEQEPPPTQQTQAQIVSVHTPSKQQMSVRRAQARQIPHVKIDVSATSDQAEFSYRVDQGPWSVFHSGPHLTVTSPLLALVGSHTIQVRARERGDYRTLDPEPMVLTVHIQPSDGDIESGEHLPPAYQPVDVEKPAVGCQTTRADPVPWGLWAWLLVVGLGLRIRRFGSQ